MKLNKISEAVKDRRVVVNTGRETLEGVIAYAGIALIHIRLDGMSRASLELTLTELRKYDVEMADS